MSHLINLLKKYEKYSLQIYGLKSFEIFRVHHNMKIPSETSLLSL